MQFVINPKSISESDVVVIGGGTAGVFAAISAAKNGIKTILVEKNSTLGGTVTTGGVNFPGLFFAWGRQIIDGPCWAAIKRTVELGGAKLPEFQYKPERHWHEQILLDNFVYRSVLFQMCVENGVEIITNTMISYIKEDADGVDLLITSKEGIHQINTKVVIDATGDANAVSMAGYDTVKSNVQQPATPQNHISGYAFENIDLEQIHTNFSKANFPPQITENKIKNSLRNHKFDIHIPCRDAETSEGRTKLEYDAIDLMMKLYTFCRSIRGLENLTVDYYAEETGVRETVRIAGETTLTAEDYINGKHFEDSVCYAFYPIDLHIMNGIKQKFLEDNIVGEIPYGALIPKGAKRILCAGRCISTDTDANSAVRVQAPCMATGQAAGCAAAISAKKNISVKEVPFHMLCRSLEEIDAIVPKGNIFG